MGIHKQFVLLSGGLDSTTALYYARSMPPKEFRGEMDKREPVEAVSIDYGQRHAKELHAAGLICRQMGIKHHIIKLPSDLLGGVMLTDKTAELPNVSYADLPPGISPTYVPFRNGLMLSLLAAYAQKWVMGEGKPLPEHRYATIYFGAHAEDAENDAYPDCSVDFFEYMSKAINEGTYGDVNFEAPLIKMFKKDIVALGMKLGVPFDYTWSCYKGERLHCGTCPTCRARKEAFIAAGAVDPTEYAV